MKSYDLLVLMVAHFATLSNGQELSWEWGALCPAEWYTYIHWHWFTDPLIDYFIHEIITECLLSSRHWVDCV